MKRLTALLVALAFAAGAFLHGDVPGVVSAIAQNKPGGYNAPSKIVQATQISPSTGTGSVVLNTSPTLVTPTLGAATATSLTFGETVLTKYKQSSYTGTLTGGTTAPTGTINYTIIGNVVTIDVPLFTVTSNATTKTITGMPAEARPATQKFFLVDASDNGSARSVSSSTVESTGVITLNFGATRAPWTNTGTMTSDAFSFTYTTN